VNGVKDKKSNHSGLGFRVDELLSRRASREILIVMRNERAQVDACWRHSLTSLIALPRLARASFDASDVNHDSMVTSRRRNDVIASRLTAKRHRMTSRIRITCFHTFKLCIFVLRTHCSFHIWAREPGL